jgi:hypothetical protein
LGLFDIVVNDNGSKNGPTYGGTITVIGNNEQTIVVPGSSWPNPSNPSPGIDTGIFPGTYGSKAHRGRTNGVTNKNK